MASAISSWLSGGKRRTASKAFSSNFVMGVNIWPKHPNWKGPWDGLAKHHYPLYARGLLRMLAHHRSRPRSSPLEVERGRQQIGTRRAEREHAVIGRGPIRFVADILDIGADHDRLAIPRGHKGVTGADIDPCPFRQRDDICCIVILRARVYHPTRERQTGDKPRIPFRADVGGDGRNADRDPAVGGSAWGRDLPAVDQRQTAKHTNLGREFT